MRFTKMHGLGNDYIYVNMFSESIGDPGKLAVVLSDRHFGIGSDGLVLIMPSVKADFRMRMFNSDGSEAEMCGNAIRCVGKYVYDNKMTKSLDIKIETLAGIKTLVMTQEGGLVNSIEVNMGIPELRPEHIPVICDKEICVDEKIWVGHEEYMFTAVSMGNPHCVVYMDDIDKLDIGKIGFLFENHKIFPRRTNTEFVEVINRNRLRMRVWERGAGETLACGTGACAVLVSSVLNDLSDRVSTVELKGGELKIRWDEEDGCVYMQGSATKVFDGEIII
jgi:diaminopimelate epimerase